MNNDLIVQNYLKQEEDERVKKLSELIDEIDTLTNEPHWGARYKEWSGRVERFLKKEYGPDALSLFTDQHSVDLVDGYDYELKQRKVLLQNILAYKDEYRADNPASHSVTSSGHREVGSRKKSLGKLASSFFISPWTITIVGGVIVIWISYYCFGIGQTPAAPINTATETTTNNIYGVQKFSTTTTLTLMQSVDVPGGRLTAVPTFITGKTTPEPPYKLISLISAPIFSAQATDTKTLSFTVDSEPNPQYTFPLGTQSKNLIPLGTKVYLVTFVGSNTSSSTNALLYSYTFNIQEQ